MRAVLTYHSIDDSGSVISVDPATFRAQMQWLAASDIAVVPLTRLLELPAGGNAVAITFDDAFQNFVKEAWPVLRDFAMPVTVFVVTDYVGQTNNWSNGPYAHVPQQPLLGWSTLTHLAAQGVMLGSHTRSHADLRHLSVGQLTDEIHGAAHAIKAETGQTQISFAYPYGLFNGDTVRVVSAVHSVACTAELRLLGPVEDSLKLPRLDAYYFRRPGLLQRFGSPPFARYLWLRSRGRRIRQVLTSSAARDE
jgi:peptidoglycan/xylan/chitin deacetylase (PgdA/CDA1 family)